MDKIKTRLKGFLRKTKIKKGFSLIELIVVIAIMAVLAVFLIPSLSHYVENSRAKKDASSADDITQAISVGLADKDVYDEILEHSIKGNVSCYIDASTEANYEKIESSTRYSFDDEARILDETPYYAAGNMRGMTITFEPKRNTSGSETEYEVKSGIINKYIPEETESLKDDKNLYNKIRSVVGETITLKSQTYRNSEMTVFIALGAGGHDKGTDKKETIEVYYQFSGTNLTAEDIEYTTTTDRVSDYVANVPEEKPEGGDESGDGSGSGGPHVHNYSEQIVAATCKDKGYTVYTCSCGDSYKENFTETSEHNYNDGTTTVYPTCTAEGSKDYECLTCGAKKSDKINALGHSYKDIVTAATCKDKGYTTHTCSRCQDSYVDSYTDAVNHVWNSGVTTKEATCTSEGTISYTCSLCSNTKTETTPKLGHNYSEVVTAPTCTAEGYTTHTCSNCGDVYVDTKVPKKNHIYGDWTIVKDATCEATGNKSRNCTVCGQSETAVIDVLGHDYKDEYITDVEATCTVEGSKSQHCSRCNSKRNAMSIPALGHSWNDGETTTQPTCEGTGTKIYTCNKCGATKSEDLNATGHNYKETVTPPTNTSEGYTLHTCLNCGLSYKDNFVDKIGVSITGTVKIIEELTANVKVELKQNGEVVYTATTDENGAFNITDMYVGEYHALVTYRETNQWTQTISVNADGDQFDFSFLLAPGVYDHDNNLLITWEELTSMDYYTVPEHEVYLGWDEELEESVYETTPAQPIFNISNDGILSTVYCDDCIWNLSIDGVVKKTKLGGYYDSELEKWVDVPLGKLIISEDVKGLDNYSLAYFDQCFSIIALPDTIETVGNNAMSLSCNEGVTINKIPNSLKSVGDYAFSYCNVLNPITELPESLVSIGLYAFQAFEFKNIYISENVTHVGGPICNGVETIVVDANNPKFDSRNNCNAIMETDTNILVAGSKNTIIPNETTGIGNYAFYCVDFTQPSQIILPNGLTFIGNYAFYDTNIVNANIGLNVKSIGNSAFYNSNIKELVVPSNVESVGSFCFAYCSSLKNAVFGANKVSDYCFRSCSSMESIEMLSSVSVIGCEAFWYCTSLTNVTIPNSVNEIQRWAFEDCTKLQEITIPGSVKTMGSDVFETCTSLKKVIIEEGFTSLGSYTFEYCKQLEYVSIPSTLTSKGSSCFETKTFYNKSTGQSYSDLDNMPLGVAAVYVTTKPLMVTFDANGGTTSTTQKVVANGEKYGTLPTPTRNSYAFALWMKESSDFEDIYLYDNKETSGATGELRDNTTYASSDLIPVDGGFTFYSNMIVCGVYTYDANKTLIERVSDYCNEHVIPSNAKYIRIEVAKINGLTYSDYENYLALGYEVTSSTINNDTADHTLYAIWAYNTAFTYNGSYYTYYALVSGTYRLNAYGAQGGASIGNGSVMTSGGPGGFASGTIYLNAGDFVYVVVGGAGANGVVGGTAAGGYNGGGSGTWDGTDDEASGGGGGATSLVLNSYRGGALLANYASYKNEVLLVAGGGGGSSWGYQGGAGGGANGGTTAGTSSSYPTQNGGYAFGQGQNGSGTADSDGVAGGGGGWYGGYANNVAAKSAGTGGSGYVGGVSNGTMEYGVRTGNGYAEITFVSR